LQLAPRIEPMSVATATDAVSPGRLFALARLRLQGAAATVRPDMAAEAPSALAASVAIRQAESGISSLRSILVPTTSFELRRRASVAIDHAEFGAQLLLAYRDLMLPFGDQTLPLATIPERARALLGDAIDQLDIAAARAFASAPLPG
jgi:hypothetical protein